MKTLLGNVKAQVSRFMEKYFFNALLEREGEQES